LLGVPAARYARHRTLLEGKKMISRGTFCRRARAGLLVTSVTAAALLANASLASAAGVTGYNVVQG
jgi:hypothetical protein